jgi:micrococcal nuclease
MPDTTVPDPTVWLFEAELPAWPTSIYDGDTYRLDIDQGFRMRMERAQVRLAGVDCPSIKGDEREDGLAARDRVRELLEPPTELVVRARAGDPQRYGRYLIDVHFTPYPAAGGASDDWHDLAAVLLEEGHAEPY